MPFVLNAACCDLKELMELFRSVSVQAQAGNESYGWYLLLGYKSRIWDVIKEGYLDNLTKN